MVVDLEQARRRLEILAEYGRETSMGKIDALLQRACVLVAGALLVQRSKVLCYRPASGDLLVVAGVGWHEGVVGHASLKTDLASPPGRAYQIGAAVTIDDLTASQEYRHSRLLRDHGVVSLINVPIFLHGRVWGVFEVDDTQPRRFDKDDENFMAALAHLLGAAIARRRADERDQTHVEKNAASLLKSELLVRELHHRIKNNFQLIVSLVLMQQRRITDPIARDALSRIAEKVISIGMAHEQLGTSAGSDAVSMAPYLMSLIARITPANPEIVVEHEIDEMEISLDRAVVIGLIVNEAFTNAEKYAFEPGQPGILRVTLKPAEDHVLLTVSDNGKGMNGGRDGAQGMSLMERLAEQLSGKLEILSDAGQGFSVRVTFPAV